MNGAQAAILEELLASSAAMNTNLQRLVSALGGATGVGEGLSGLGKKAGIAGVAISAVAAAGSLVSSAFSGLVSIAKSLISGLTQTVGNLYQFSLQAAIGSAKLSDFYASFKNLPFFVGTLFGILSDLTKYNEILLENYQKLTQVGATFGGNLSTLAQQAARSYMTLDQFAKVVSENSDVFATMGGNVQNGINRFVQVQNQLMGPGSPYARQILGLGFTFEEAGGLVASYMRGQGTMNKESLQNNALVMQGVKDYALQLDTLTKLTGKRREQIEKEVREIEEEESWQQYLATLPANAAATARAALMQAQAVGGKDFGTSMRLAIQTGITTPLTEEGKNFSVTSRGARETYLTAMADAIRGGKSLKEVQTLGYQNSQMLVNANKQTFSSMGQLNGVLAITNPAFTRAMNATLAYGRTVGDQDKALTQINKQQQEQARGSAEAMARAELAARQFGLQLLGLISTAIQPIVPLLRSLAQGIASTLTALIGSTGFRDAIKMVATWFSDTFEYLAAAGSAKDFVDRLKNVFMNMFESMQPYLEYLIGMTMGYIKKYATDYLNPFSNLRNLMQAQEQLDKAVKSGRDVDYWRKEVGRLSDIRDKEYEDYFAGVNSALNMRLKASEAATAARQTSGQPPRRHSGTAGILGLTEEPMDTEVSISKGERVLNPAETTFYNNLASQVAVLNNTTAQLLSAMKQTAENTRKTYDATKSLNGNVLHQVT